MKPTQKAPELEEIFKTLFGYDRKKSIESDVCALCNSSVSEDSFRTPLAKKEFTISGMCQKCQDEFSFDEE